MIIGSLWKKRRRCLYNIKTINLQLSKNVKYLFYNICYFLSQQSSCMFIGVRDFSPPFHSRSLPAYQALADHELWIISAIPRHLRFTPPPFPTSPKQWQIHTNEIPDPQLLCHFISARFKCSYSKKKSYCGKYLEPRKEHTRQKCWTGVKFGHLSLFSWTNHIFFYFKDYNLRNKIL